MSAKKFARKNHLVLRWAALGTLLASTLSAVPVRAADGVLTLKSPVAQAAEPVTVYNASTALIGSLDPQVADDVIEIDVIENLFLGLTDVDPVTSEIRPELATDWTQNEAGDVFTFTLREDVPWVKYDATSGTVTEIRKVTPADFVYGIKRACDPRLGATYTFVAAALIKGCDIAANIPTDQFKASDLDQVAVKATGNKLEITLQGPFAYFLQTSGMWMMRPIPSEIVEEFGAEWVEPANIVTNGSFAVSEYDSDVSLTLVTNPLYVRGIRDEQYGNIERRVLIFVPEQSTTFALYNADQIDLAGVPSGDVDTVRESTELNQELSQRVNLGTYYFAYAMEKAPFDKAEVRRAFSAVVDRALLVSEVNQGIGVPISHFMPPGIFGSIPLNTTFIGQPSNPGYDVEYAKAQLAQAGYPNCEGFPEITILTTAGSAPRAAFWQNAITSNLGCDVSKIKLEQAEFSVLQAATTADASTRPNAWFISWFADYADAQNWVHDVLGCKTNNDFNRPCTEVDTIIDNAAKEPDQDKRAALYAQVEELLFGQEGEFPIAPIYIAQSYTVIKPWYTGPFETDAIFGGSHYELYTIDQTAQLAARGGANVPLIAPTVVPTPEVTAEAAATEAATEVATAEATVVATP